MWKYAEADFEAFRNILATADWNACFQTDNVDTAVDTWNTIIMDAAAVTIPNKLVTVRPNDHPWYKGYLRRLKRDKNRKFREYSRSNTPENLASYRNVRNEYFVAIRKAQFDYESNKQQALATEAGRCPKKWWRLAKEMLGMAQTSQIPAMLVDSIVINDDREKAEAFNNICHKYVSDIWRHEIIRGIEG
jgi:hypothetical protein